MNATPCAPAAGGFEPPLRLLHDGLFRSARMHPDKVAVIVEGEPHSYGELLTCSGQCAAALIERGLIHGERVVVFCDNTWAAVLAIYGVLTAGGVIVVVNPQTKSDKLAFIIEDSEATFLIADGHLHPAFLPIAPRLGRLRGILCAGAVPQPVPDGAPRIEPLFEVLAQTALPELPLGETINLDLAALIYTSGSTGTPKGVMMTHRAMVFACESLCQYLRLDATHRILNLLPLAFDYGLYQLLMSVRLGGTLVLERSFVYPAQIVNRVRESEVTVFPGVPTVFSTLIGAHRRQALCFPLVTRVTNTAAALPAAYNRTLREIFPNALIFRMYGLTECKRVCYLEPEQISARPDSVGKAIPGTQTLVLTADNRPAQPGEVGVLHVRGQHIMAGYWKQPDLTAAMLKDGPLPGEKMLCTQDWFKADAEGYLYFVGRSDDIIKTQGKKVSPVEVENVLHEMPGVREAAVIGVADERLGQAIKAFVVCQEGSVLSESEVRKYCLSKLENFMVPATVEFVPELPKTQTGKIRKKRLQQAWA